MTFVAPIAKSSIKAALSSTLSIVVLVYGAIALFNQCRDWFSLPLAPPMASLVAFYRQSIEAILEIPATLTGIRIPWFWQDILVIWLAVGRIASRTYALLYSDSQNFGVRYEPLEHGLFRRLGSWTVALVRRLPQRLQWLATFPSGMAATLLWPWILPTLVKHPTVTKEERWRVPFEGGTPHPIQSRWGPRERELPAEGKEYKPKFSTEHVKDFPRHDTNVILATYAIVQLGLAGVLLVLNRLAM